MKITCPTCGGKDESEFNFRDRKKGIRQHYCRDCTRKYSKQYYNDNRESEITRLSVYSINKQKENALFVYEYLRKHPCIDCGEDDPIVLDFDHVRGHKKHSICLLSNSSYSLNVIKKEIKKCEIRCANCHRRKTAKERNYLRYAIVAQGSAASS